MRQAKDVFDRAQQGVMVVCHVGNGARRNERRQHDGSNATTSRAIESGILCVRPSRLVAAGLVVTSGAVTFGMGDKLNKADTANKTLGPGGYFLASANMNHFAFAGGAETVVQINSVGPFAIKYVNPADDPSKSQ